MTSSDIHKIDLDELYGRLGSSPAGLSNQTAERRIIQVGRNILEPSKGPPLILRFAGHLFNFFAILLWVGALLAFMAENLSPGEGNVYIGIALSAVVIINAAFTFFQEYQAEKIIESFRNMMPLTIGILRDGQRTEIASHEIVPGDVIFLEEGDKVPADGRLIEQNALKVDHSSLTGESEPQLRALECTHEDKLESRNMVFSGTSVQSGNGVAIIYETGGNTQIGNIAELTNKTERSTSPLKKELDHFIKIISTIAILLGVVFFAIGFSISNQIMASVIFAIGIIVANVPEGLLPTVTLCLAMASKRMARKNALVKRLDSIETLGSTTVICTDKTGTVTENRISVHTLLLNLDERNIHEKGIDLLPGMKELLKVAILCNNARKLQAGNFHGDPTETALLKFAQKHEDIEKVQSENPRKLELPFDSIQRKMITVNLSSNADDMAYLKGAPEIVLNKSSSIIFKGRVMPLSEKRKKQIMRYYERFASRGERVLGFAYHSEPLNLETGFTFIGLVGMIDPPRRDVPEAIIKCKRAGIKVIMITGDYSVTAEAIAAMVGLVERHKANIMTGDDLNQCDEAQLIEFLLKDHLLFTRTTPRQKLRIVKTLQGMGEIVTVTGDGVNDAPALKQADMGVAMGLSGTEVAKEAADMVLFDDHFATIVNAIEEGRTVFGNIRKFITYILTSNIPEILPFIAFTLFTIPLPLTVVLILSIDLGTDILPALALGVESSEDDVMKKPPRPMDQRLLTPGLLFRSYGVIGMIEAGAGFFSYFSVLYSNGWIWGQKLAPTDPVYLKAVTAFFVSIIICQIANVMVCRTQRESLFKKGILTNKFVLIGIASELLLVELITNNEMARTVFGTHSLTLSEGLLALPFAILIVVVEECRKWGLRNRKPFAIKYLNW